MKENLKNVMAAYRARVGVLAGVTASVGNISNYSVYRKGNPEMVVNEMDAIFGAALAAGDTEQMALKAGEDYMRQLLDRSRNKDQDAIVELNELRMEKVDLYVRARSNFATMLYETVPLKDNEQACIEHSYRNAVGARYVGQDGGARTVKAVKARSQRFIDMREITSDEVGYQIRDIQQGTDIAAQSGATVDLSWDLANKVDIEAYGLLVGGTFNGKSYGNGVYGSFVTSGSKLAQTYLPNPRINTANLPTTNDITNTMLNNLYDIAGGLTTGFRLSVIRAIIDYCNSWGDIFGAPVRPTGAIFIPSSETIALTKEITPTGIVNNPVAQGILSNFTQFEYMNVKWTLIPDVTLPKGRCYVVLNRPVAKMLVKPQFDEEWVETNKRNNWETRGAKKCVAFYTLEAWRPFALRVAYVASPAAQQDLE